MPIISEIFSTECTSTKKYEWAAKEATKQGLRPGSNEWWNYIRANMSKINTDKNTITDISIVSGSKRIVLNLQEVTYVYIPLTDKEKVALGVECTPNACFRIEKRQ